MEDKILSGYSIDTLTREDAFKKISQKVAKHLFVNKREVYSSLYHREIIANTALIDGIATPHIVVDSFFSPQVFVFKLKNELKDWVCLDGTKVKVLICLAIPKGLKADDLKVSEIQKVFTKLADENIDYAISRAKTFSEIIRILKN